MVTASRAVKQPAVLGSTKQPCVVEHARAASRGLAGSTRRIATVAISAPEARTAAAIDVEVAKAARADDQAGARRCGRRSRSVLTPSSSLNGVQDLDVLAARDQRRGPSCRAGTTSPSSAAATPRPSAGAPAARTASATVAPSGSVVRRAVEHDRGHRTARGSGRDGTGGPTRAARRRRSGSSACAVSGASSTPLRSWPVAHTSPSIARRRSPGALSGVRGPQSGAGADQLQLADVGQHLQRGLEQAEHAVGGDRGVEALLLRSWRRSRTRPSPRLTT